MTCGRTYVASRGRFPYDEGKHLTMVLELHAYSDESGGIDEPCCTVAGFIASPRQWKLFSANWTAVLERADVPVFHATDFFSRAGWQSSASPYHDWSDEKALRFQRELTDVFLRQHKRLHRANGAVDVNDYKELSEDWKRVFTGAMIKWNVRAGQFTSRLLGTGKPSAPWFLCFIDFVQHILTHAPDGSFVHLTCDETKEYAPLAQITWNNMKKHKAFGWRKMGDLTFAGDEWKPALQLADSYAHLLNHAIPRYGKGLDNPARAEMLNALLKDGEPVFMHTEQTLEKRAVEITEAIMNEIELHYGSDETGEAARPLGPGLR